MTFRPVWTADRIEQMLALKAEGLSDYQVAARMGVSRTAVANKLSRMRHPQVRTRPATGWTEDRVALVKTLWIAGKSAQEVADALNRAKAAIVSRMNAEPAKPRPPKVEAVPLAAIESPNARPWMEREFGQCAWPLGEAGAIMSCCNPVSRGSYCEGHAAAAFVSIQRADWVQNATRFAWSDRVETPVRPKPARPASGWDDARAAA